MNVFARTLEKTQVRNIESQISVLPGNGLHQSVHLFAILDPCYRYLDHLFDEEDMVLDTCRELK